MALEIDEKDKLLLALLRTNARAPIVELARKLDLSRSATQARLAKLVSGGAIQSFTIVENPNQGQLQAAHLLLRLEKGKTCAQVVPKLKSLALARVIHSIAGDQDIIIHLVAETIADIESARKTIAAIPGIAEVKTFVTMQSHRG
jgi:Lrp/AsnC family transcriptional regulator, leucine-responsive regulatory protein